MTLAELIGRLNPRFSTKTIVLIILHQFILILVPSGQQQQTAARRLTNNATPYNHHLSQSFDHFLHTNDVGFNPLGPLVRCDYLPMDFLECDPLVDHKGNDTAQKRDGHGCLKVRWQLISCLLTSLTIDLL